MAHPDELSELERDGWQLLLWSFRHELGLDDSEPGHVPSNTCGPAAPEPGQVPR